MKECYLDYAGSARIIKEWLHESTTEILSAKYGNPHSTTFGISEANSITQKVNECRDLLFQSIGSTSNDYILVFTSGTTDSIRKIGEWFNFDTILYTKRNHNSVLGLRNIYAKKGSEIIQLDDNFTPSVECMCKGSTLLAIPAECNFSGKQLDWRNAKDRFLDAYLLLDVAKYTSTSILNVDSLLPEHKPDFIPISLYKWIGYPTGLGALFIHKRMVPMISKVYYGGGTIDFNSLSSVKTIPKKDIVSSLEDGTLPFLSIVSAGVGLRHFLSQRETRFHTIRETTQSVYVKLLELRYTNGKKLIEMYTSDESVNSIITFNILNQDGRYIGYSDVERLASASGICLRVGCFCNPGACAIHLGLTDEELEYNYSQGHTCSNHKENIRGKPTGAIRISFGWNSIKADGDYFIDWLTSTFLSSSFSSAIQNEYFSNRSEKKRIAEFIVYPIKSCPGFVTDKWKITHSGLEYDRMFAIYDTKNRLVTIQKNIRLGLIVPYIDADTGYMKLTNRETEESIEFNTRVYSESVKESCNAWLSEQLGEEVVCVKSESDSNFSNTSPYLVISKESLMDLNRRILDKNGYIRRIPNVYWWKEKVVEWYPSIGMERFRPNIVLEGCLPYEEDTITSFTIGETVFRKDKDCERCYTTTMNTKKQTRDVELEPMKTLLTYRKMDNGVTFGSLFYTDMCESRDIQVGEIEV